MKIRRGNLSIGFSQPGRFIAIFPSVLKVYGGHGYGCAVGEGQGDVANAHTLGEGAGAPAEMQRGTAPRLPPDFELLPRYTVLNAGAESLCTGFLSGKPPGIAFGCVLLAAAIGDLAGGKDAMQEAVSKALDGPGHAIDFNDVNPGAENHARKLNEFGEKAKCGGSHHPRLGRARFCRAWLCRAR